MAERPVFVPNPARGPLVYMRNLSLHWHSGFAPIQKQRNIAALHEAAKKVGLYPTLEVSTKSPDKIGQRLSAFSLKITVGGIERTLESVYQSSKVFEKTGPLTHLIEKDPKTAKRMARELGKGEIISFRFEGNDYATEPKNAFYDWLYIRAISPHDAWLRKNLAFSAFSDIEFNPSKSINCQGRAVAEYVALSSRGDALKCAEDFDTFRKLLALAQRHEVF